MSKKRGTTIDWPEKESLSLEEFEETIGVDVDALQLDSQGTIVARPEAFNSQASMVLSNLRPFSFSSDQHPDALADLELHQTLGEGGMGIVQLATQLPLQREVAVKRLREDKSHPGTIIALLHEAWITGMLEHPNIIPIHTLGNDPNGHPAFVMKRVTGETWNKMMHDPAHPGRPKHHKDDLLGWNLQLLMQVCNAVHFAHSNGILHRDLKPTNVMIGSFGEVYVLDWGIAVSLRDDEKRPIPRVSDLNGIAGTPSYMAPEMALNQPEALSPRTDVYLLGAILYEILTGHPPHIGSNLMSMLYHAASATPLTLPSSIPQELAAICTKATHPNPDERFASAEELHNAIDEFLQHRASIEIAQEASQLRLVVQAWIEATLGAQEETPSASDSQKLLPFTPGLVPEDVSSLSKEARHVRIYGLYHECKFGFQQAMRTWDDNQHAQRELEALNLMMAQYELANGDPKAASLHMASLRNPPNELQEQLQALSKQKQQKQQVLQQIDQLKDELEVRISARVRYTFSLIMALCFVVTYLAFGPLLGWAKFNYTYYTLLCFLYIGLVVSPAFWGRKHIFSNRASRRLVFSSWALGIGYTAQSISGYVLGLPPEHSLTQGYGMVALYNGVMAVMFSPKGVWAFLIFLTGYLCMSFWPTYLFEFAAVGFLFGIPAILYYWEARLLQEPS